MKRKEKLQKDKEIIESHFLLPENYFYIYHQENIIALASRFKDAYTALLKNLYVKKMGLTIGALKGADLIPSHALAMSHWDHLPFQSLEVDKETALQYLRRAVVDISGAPGWYVIRYNNTPLGWLKLLQNRSNNYYPNEWRILNY